MTILQLANKFSVQISFNEIKNLSYGSSSKDFNDTIIEILKKVTALVSVSDKLENCLLIVQIITIRSGPIPDKFYPYIIHSKNRLIDPKEYDKELNLLHMNPPASVWENDVKRSYIENQEMNSFLFHLRYIDYYCYIDLINYYDKLNKKIIKKEQLFLYVFYGVIIILIIIAISYFSY